MNIKEARELINKECIADDGLDALFRMSADVAPEQILNFITALKYLEQHYQNKPLIEKDLVYQLFNLHQTLQGSMGHWKVSRPEGLDAKTCFEIFTSIRNVFTD